MSQLRFRVHAPLLPPNRRSTALGVPREVATMPRRCDEYDLSSSFASNQETKKGLMDHLGSACFSDKFSDMKVRLSNGEEINCHRVIVCGQCQFFDNALKDGRFREGQTGAVDMPNDHPHAVKALLEFCYKGGYTVDTDIDICDKLLFHTDVMNVAAVYNVEPLENVAAGMVHSYLQSNWNTVIPILPDVFRVFEQLSSPTRSKWSPHMLRTLIDGAFFSTDLLLETETWGCLWKYAEEFMEEVTRRMEEKWVNQGLFADIAQNWLTKLLGAEALRVVKCPSNWCPVIKRGLILQEESIWVCDYCNSEVESIDWLSPDSDAWSTNLSRLKCV